MERYPQEIEGLDGARRRLLVTNNLFDYASCVGLPRQNVDLIEQQYIRTRLGVKRFLKKFIQIIEVFLLVVLILRDYLSDARTYMDHASNYASVISLLL